MNRIAYFAHNVGDAAVRRRVVGLRRAGFDVVGFMYRRGPAPEVDYPLVDLGETKDGAYVQRIRALTGGAARLAAEHADTLRMAEVILARNLDMLSVAIQVKKKLKLSAPVIFECLDVHKLLTGSGPISAVLRGIEGGLLRNTDLVVVSSPAFEREHFAKRYPGRSRFHLLENRLVEGDEFSARPVANPLSADPDRALRIGWFGNLRCARSLELLGGVAQRFGERVEIRLRGYPAPHVQAPLEAAVAAHANIWFGGRYQAPQDLEAIYGDVDLIWSGDWFEEGANSLWLLPNRIYEGGYFATPSIAPNGTETARWLADRAVGFLVDDPVQEKLEDLVGRLIRDRAPIDAMRAQMLALPRETFVQTDQALRDMIAAATQS